MHKVGRPPGSGHRISCGYSLDQVPAAQVILRLREPDMPVPDVKSVVATQDAVARNQLITTHLARLENTSSPGRKAPSKRCVIC